MLLVIIIIKMALALIEGEICLYLCVLLLVRGCRMALLRQ